MLQPIAAPSILGLFGFAGATFIVAANLTGVVGNEESAKFLFPFAAVFGGVAQFLAGMWAYRARDGVATAMHGTWGSFWIAFGILQVLGLAHAVTLPLVGESSAELALWFWVLAAITAAGTIAAAGESVGLMLVLAPLAVGSGLAAGSWMNGNATLMHAAGWVFIGAAGVAFYVASALMIGSAWGRTVLPLGKPGGRRRNVPGEAFADPIEFAYGEPGVRAGQ
jgi:succinate-acetate transporter protein